VYGIAYVFLTINTYGVYGCKVSPAVMHIFSMLGRCDAKADKLNSLLIIVLNIKALNILLFGSDVFRGLVYV